MISILNKIKYRYLVRSLIPFFRRTFSYKNICLVGNAANLYDDQNGAIIDAADLVVRFNIATFEGREEYAGKRTDFRFLGVTLHGEWLEGLKKIKESENIISYEKNRKFLRRKRSIAVLIPDFIPTAVINLFNRSFPMVEDLPISTKPPRSGVVLILLILIFAKETRIMLTGFSRKEQDFYISSYTKDTMRQEDLARFQSAHCNPDDELIIFNILSRNNLIEFL